MRHASLIVVMLLVGCVHDYRRWAPEETDLERLTGKSPAVRAMIESGQGTTLIQKFHGASWGRGDPFVLFNLLKIRGFAPGRSPDPAADPAGGRDRLGEINALKLQAMYAGEYGAIRAAGRDPRVGLALSGGGIRSASFATGFLQGLHEIGLLRRIGYISSVSGGGYAAGWYMTHGGKRRVHNDFQVPGDRELLSPASLHLRHLTQNGNYLVSTHFSGRTVELFTSFGMQGLTLPFHWVINGILDLDWNLSWLRRNYRLGIRRAFLYGTPCNQDRSDVGNPLAIGPMASLVPTPDNKLPLWIINMHIALPDDDTSQHRNRSGDAFELTPIRGGSDGVGYVLSRSPKRSRYWMTPEYAVAISGAALDARSLLHPEGLSLGLNILNGNLGYYIDGWARHWTIIDFKNESRWSSIGTLVGYWTSSFTMSWMVPSFSRRRLHLGEKWHSDNQHAKRYYITDGGHFDNLGVYALVRRGCRVIVVSDCEQDDHANGWEEGSAEDRARAFSGLRNLEERLIADFGARVEFDWTEFVPGELIIGHIRNLPLDRQQDDGSWREAEEDPGVVILYFRAAYNLAEFPRSSAGFVDAEKVSDPSFPSEPTANQFYSERKVLAYRELARKMVVDHAAALRGAFDFETPAPDSSARP